jgi:hypothetical protein
VASLYSPSPSVFLSQSPSPSSLSWRSSFALPLPVSLSLAASLLTPPRLSPASLSHTLSSPHLLRSLPCPCSLSLPWPLALPSLSPPSPSPLLALPLGLSSGLPSLLSFASRPLVCDTINTTRFSQSPFVILTLSSSSLAVLPPSPLASPSPLAFLSLLVLASHPPWPSPPSFALSLLSLASSSSPLSFLLRPPPSLASSCLPPGPPLGCRLASPPLSLSLVPLLPSPRPPRLADN